MLNEHKKPTLFLGDMMSDAISRRDFFRKDLLKLLFKSGSEEPLTEIEERQKSLEAYFASPSYSYPLLQEMPWDFLISEATSRGIPVEGRNKNEIARDMFLKINETLKNTF
jgi:hypothetical protein